MIGVSPAFQAAMSQSHKGAIRVDICSPTGAVLQSLVGGTTPGCVTGGNVDVDETRQVRRILTMTVESAGRTVDNLIPRAAGDLLHPASMNELRVYRGVTYANGTSELCPVGVFRISKPKSKKQPGGTFELTITGQDRSAWISRLVWQAPYEVSAGTELATGLYNAINSIVPGLSYNMPPTGVSMPDTIWGTDLTTGANDPWADFMAAAAYSGYALFFDPSGVVTLSPSVDPITQNLANVDGVPLPTFVNGQNCTLTEVGALIDETVEYNGVIVISTPPGATAALQGSAWITDPTSPQYYLGPWGQVPYIIQTTMATSTAQCDAMAAAQLQLIYRAMDTIDFSCVPNASLEEGDAFTIVDPDMGVSANYVYSASIIPLDWKTDQTVTCRPQVNANGT